MRFRPGPRREARRPRGGQFDLHAYTNISPLRNPARDARLIADTLRGLGFALTGNGALINLDKAGFDRTVQSFGAQLQSADVALFYYAGHGIQLHGANYLVPIDANVTREADAEFQMLNVNRVLEQMDPADGPGRAAVGRPQSTSATATGHVHWPGAEAPITGPAGPLTEVDLPC
jgi:hypothetical protein